MARPTAFNRDKAVASAMGLFWSKGYTATSMSQLLAAMGIGRSSFYAAFEDKRSLYIECLDLFYQQTLLILQRAWDKHQSPAAFREFFYQTTFELPESYANCGCLVVNTVLELADVEEDLNRRAVDYLEKLEAEFADCIRQAQQIGNFSRDRSPENLAASLMLINQGLRVAGRKGLSKEELNRTVDSGLAAIGLVTD